MQQTKIIMEKQSRISDRLWGEVCCPSYESCACSLGQWLSILFVLGALGCAGGIVLTFIRFGDHISEEPDLSDKTWEALHMAGGIAIFYFVGFLVNMMGLIAMCCVDASCIRGVYCCEWLNVCFLGFASLITLVCIIVLMTREGLQPSMHIFIYISCSMSFLCFIDCCILSSLRTSVNIINDEKKDDAYI